MISHRMKGLKDDERRLGIGSDYVRYMQKHLKDPMTRIREEVLAGLSQAERAVAIELAEFHGERWTVLTVGERRKILTRLCKQHEVERVGGKSSGRAENKSGILRAATALANMKSSDLFLQSGRVHFSIPFSPESRPQRKGKIGRRGIREKIG